MEMPKKSTIWTTPRQEIEQVVAKATTFREILNHFGYSYLNVSYMTVKKYLDKLEIDYSHLVNDKAGNKGRRVASDVLVDNATCSQQTLRNVLRRENIIPFICNRCGIGEIWNNYPIVLQVHHVNGRSNDNRLENLEILCPNCHSQTDTYCRKLK